MRTNESISHRVGSSVRLHYETLSRRCQTEKRKRLSEPSSMTILQSLPRPKNDQQASWKLQGIVPPLLTPLESRDAIDPKGLERLIDRMLLGGVHGLFILGTTGEGPSL